MYLYEYLTFDNKPIISLKKTNVIPLPEMYICKVFEKCFQILFLYVFVFVFEEFFEEVFIFVFLFA